MENVIILMNCDKKEIPVQFTLPSFVPSSPAQANRRAIASLVRKQPGIGRQKISSILGLSLSLVNLYTTELMKAGWIQAIGKTGKHVGRKMENLVPVQGRASMLCVHARPDGVTFRLIDWSGLQQPSESRHFPGPKSQKAFITSLETFLEEVSGSASSENRMTVVSLDGLAHLDHGLVFKVQGLESWEPLALGDILGRRIKGEALMLSDNTSHLFALTHDRQEESFLRIRLGRELSFSAVVGNSILKGLIGSAGELSHLRLDPRGPDCFCGGNGCLEALPCPAQWRAIEGQLLKNMKKTYSPLALFVQCEDTDLELPQEAQGIPVFSVRSDEETLLRGASHYAAQAVLHRAMP